MQNIESPVLRSYRELLRVPDGATQEEVKKAFRAMAKVYHPDTNTDATATAVFMRIREAYKALTDRDAAERLNRSYLAGQYSARCAKGLDLRIGSFFGHRSGDTSRRMTADREDLPWWEPPPPLRIDAAGRTSYEPPHMSDVSIMDDPSLDLVEVIFAGQFRTTDERALLEAFRRRDFSVLPWFTLNNEGIVHFLDRDFEAALGAYTELNARIPDNIVFLFRLGVCHEILAFRDAGDRLFHPARRRRHIAAAIDAFERAIVLGETRPHLPQQCLTIRKTLADLLQLTHRHWRAKRIWSRIRDLDPGCAEARVKLTDHALPRRGLLPSRGARNGG